MSKPIEVILNEARLLLQEVGSRHPVGDIWRDKVTTWVQDAADWSTGNPPGELSEVQLDPGVEVRVSKLEQAVVSLAVSVAGLQTLALQGNADAALTQWELARRYEPDREVELLDGSKMRIKDVPLGEDGMPEEEWAMVNCPCPTHEEKRSRKAAAEQQVGGKSADPATGMYL